MKPIKKSDLEMMKKLKPVSLFLLKNIKEVSAEFRKLLKTSQEWTIENMIAHDVLIVVDGKKIHAGIQKLKTSKTGLLHLLYENKFMKQYDDLFQKYLQGENIEHSNQLCFVADKKHAGKYFYSVTLCEDNPVKENGIVFNRKGQVVKSQQGHIFFDPDTTPKRGQRALSALMPSGLSGIRYSDSEGKR